MRYRIRAMVTEQPFELFTSLLCAVSGVSVVFTPVRPGTISEALPPWLQIIWGVSLGVGGVLVTLGIWARAINPNWYQGGLATEYSGMVFTACATVVYSIVIVTQAPLNRALVSILLLVALSASSLARAYTIHSVLKRIQNSEPKDDDRT